MAAGDYTVKLTVDSAGAVKNISMVGDAVEDLGADAKKAREGIEGLGDSIDETGNSASGAAGGISGASTAVGGLGRSSSTSVALVGKLSAAVAGFGVAAAAAAVAGKTMSATLDATFRGISRGGFFDDLSAQLGVTVENLTSVDTLLRDSGVSIESYALAIKTLSKNLFDFKNDTGEARVALETLGLDKAAVAGLSASEAFALISPKLAEVGNSAERTALAMKIFGESGTALGPLLAQSSSEIERLIDLNERLGLSLSTSQAAILDTVADNVSILGTVLDGVGQQIAIGLAPGLNEALEALIELSATLVSGGNSAQAFGRDLGAILSDLAEDVRKLTDRVRGMELSEAFDEILAPLSASLGEAGAKLGYEFVGGFLRGLFTTKIDPEEIARQLGGQGLTDAAKYLAANAGNEAGAEFARRFGRSAISELPTDLAADFYGQIASDAALKAGDEFASALRSGSVQGMQSVRAAVESEVNALKNFVNSAEFKLKFEADSDAANEMKSKIELLEKQVESFDKTLASSFDPSRDDIKRLQDSFEPVTESVNDLGEGAKKLKEEFNSLVETTQESNEELRITAEVYDQSAAAGLTLEEAERKVTVALIEHKAAQIALTDDNLAKAYREQALAALDYEDSIAKSAKSMQELGEKTLEVQETTEKSFLGLGQIGNEVKNSFNEVFDAIVAGTLKIEDVFKNLGLAVGKNLFNQILDEKFKFDNIFEGNILDLGVMVVDYLGGAFSDVFRSAGRGSGSLSRLLSDDPGGGLSLGGILTFGGSGGIINIGGSGGGLNLLGSGGGGLNLFGSGSSFFGGAPSVAGGASSLGGVGSGVLLPPGYSPVAGSGFNAAAFPAAPTNLVEVTSAGGYNPAAFGGTGPSANPGFAGGVGFANIAAAGFGGMAGGVTVYNLLAPSSTGLRGTALQGSEADILGNLNNAGMIGAGIGGLGAGVGAGIAAGAALGATAGSAVPVLGTIAGALVGAMMGIGASQLSKGIDSNALRTREISGIGDLSTSAGVGGAILTGGSTADGAFGTAARGFFGDLMFGIPGIGHLIGAQGYQDALFGMLGIPTLGNALRGNAKEILTKAGLLNLDGSIIKGGAQFDFDNNQRSTFYSPEIADIVTDRRRELGLDTTPNGNVFEGRGGKTLDIAQFLLGEEGLEKVRGFSAVISQVAFGDGEFADQVRSQAAGFEAIFSELFASLADNPNIDSLDETIQTKLRSTFANLGVDAGTAFGAIEGFAAHTFAAIENGGVGAEKGITQVKSAAEGMLHLFRDDLPEGIDIGHLVFDSLTIDGVKAFDTFSDEAKASLEELAQDSELWSETLVNLLEQGFEIDTEHLQNRITDINASFLFLSENLPGTIEAVAAAGGDAEDVTAQIFENVKAQAHAAFAEMSQLSIVEAITGGPDSAGIANGALEPVMNVIRRLTTTDEFDLSTVTGVKDFQTNLDFALALGKKNLKEMEPAIQTLIDTAAEMDEVIKEAFSPDPMVEFFQGMERRIGELEQQLQGVFSSAVQTGLSAANAILEKGGSFEKAAKAGSKAFAEAFGDSIEDAVSNAILTAMTNAAIIQGAIAPLLTELEVKSAAFMEDGILSASEQAELTAIGRKIIAEGEYAASTLGPIFEQIFGIKLESTVLTEAEQRILDLAKEHGVLPSDLERFLTAAEGVDPDALTEFLRLIAESEEPFRQQAKAVREYSEQIADAVDEDTLTAFFRAADGADPEVLTRYFQTIEEANRQVQSAVDYIIAFDGRFDEGDRDTLTAFFEAAQGVDPEALTAYFGALKARDAEAAKEAERRAESIADMQDAMADLVPQIDGVTVASEELAEAAKQAAKELRRVVGGSIVNGAAASGGRFGNGMSALVGEAGRPEIVQALPGGGFEVTPITWSQASALMAQGIPAFSEGGRIPVTGRLPVGEGRVVTRGSKPTRRSDDEEFASFTSSIVSAMKAAGESAGNTFSIVFAREFAGSATQSLIDAAIKGFSESSVMQGFADDIDKIAEDAENLAASGELTAENASKFAEEIAQKSREAAEEAEKLEPFLRELRKSQINLRLDAGAINTAILEAAEGADLGDRLRVQFYNSLTTAIIEAFTVDGPIADSIADWGETLTLVIQEAMRDGLTDEEIIGIRAWGEVALEDIEKQAEAAVEAAKIIASSPKLFAINFKESITSTISSAITDGMINGASDAEIIGTIKQGIMRSVVDGIVQGFIMTSVLMPEIQKLLEPIAKVIGQVLTGEITIAAARAALETPLATLGEFLDGPEFQGALELIKDVVTTVKDALGISAESATEISRSNERSIETVERAAKVSCDLVRDTISLGQAALDVGGESGIVTIDRFIPQSEMDRRERERNRAEAPAAWEAWWAANRDEYPSGRRRSAVIDFLEENPQYSRSDLGRISYFAQGGLVTSPTLGVVGEAGPELIVPLNNVSGAQSTTGLSREIAGLREDLRKVASAFEKQPIDVQLSVDGKQLHTAVDRVDRVSRRVRSSISGGR